MRDMKGFLKSYFNFIKRFIPEKPVESSIGIDIGLGECRAVEIIMKDSGFSLLGYAIEPIKEANPTNAIKKILEKFDGATKPIYTSVCGKGCLIRYINMPRMSEDDLRNSFDLESDKYFPFAQDQIYTDCFILDDKNKGSQMPVIAAAVKKEIIDERVNLLNILNITPNFIGINPIALANSLNVLNFNFAAQDEAYAVLDMGETVSTLIISINNVPRFTRDIFIGTKDLYKSIANALGVNFQDVEKLVKEPKDKIDTIIDACESTVINVIQEIKLSFDYFSTEHNKEVTKIFVSGAGSLIEGIPSSFGKNIGMDINILNPLCSIEIADEISKDDINKIASKLGVALGLALYNYD